MNKPLVATKHKTEYYYDKFRNFILDDSHPCLMAKSAFSAEQVHFQVYEKMSDQLTSQKILTDLDAYIPEALSQKKDFHSFIAAFPNLTFADENVFEKKMWSQLQMLHNLDEHPWNEKVSDDTTDSNFSFSLRGQAFYIIGMHPNSSRMSRQTPYPALVFNLHSQFEQLRNMGAYHRVRNKIRKRDFALQGSNNPMLSDFGTSSEAKQYSGKATDDSWKCPFLNQKK